nr:family 43 glycosylhydrolase [Pelagicoccus enzymogenes]
MASSLAQGGQGPARAASPWARGIEGQRKADLGNGTFLNPILSGDHPDPTVLKDGEDYYMTFSSFNSYPGIVIWHSRDLVNWRPVGPALRKSIGTVWALDLCKHGDRYYVYIPAFAPGKPFGTYVIWADNIEGPWSDPIDLKIDGCIDPGHVVGERACHAGGRPQRRLADDLPWLRKRVPHARAADLAGTDRVDGRRLVCGQRRRAEKAFADA